MMAHRLARVLMRVIVSSKFKRQFSKLTVEIRRRASAAALAIKESADPASLGTRKGIAHLFQDCPGCVIFAYVINRSYRLLYCVRKGCLTFVSVGDHNEVHRKS